MPRRVKAKSHRTKRKPKKKVSVSQRHLLQMLKDSKVRRTLSKAFKGQPKPSEIYPTNGFMAFTVRPSQMFQQGAFTSRYVGRRGTLLRLGCPVGQQYDTGLCAVGQDVHRIDIPKQRVFRILRDIRERGVARVSRRPRRRKAANPLLLTVNPPVNVYPNPPVSVHPNPPVMPNPTTGVQVKIPFRKGQKISIERFERWLKENCPDAWVKSYYQSKKQYKKFHQGTLPKHVTMEMLPFGGDMLLPPEFMYSAGLSPAETYTPDKRSGKAPNSYVHEYKDRPHVLVGGEMGDQFVLKPLRGRARVDDWFRD